MTTIKLTGEMSEVYMIRSTDLAELESAVAAHTDSLLTRTHAAQCRALGNMMLSDAGKVELILTLQAMADAVARAGAKHCNRLADRAK